MFSISWINIWNLNDAGLPRCNLRFERMFNLYSIWHLRRAIAFLSPHLIIIRKALSNWNPIAIWPKCEPFALAHNFCCSFIFVNTIWWPVQIRHARLHPNWHMRKCSVDNFLFKMPRDQYWVSYFYHKKLKKRILWTKKNGYLIEQKKIAIQLILTHRFPITCSQFSTIFFPCLCVNLCLSLHQRQRNTSSSWQQLRTIKMNKLIRRLEINGE